MYDNDGNDVHYMLYNGTDGPTVVCVQWFDMPDYSEDHWITSHKFDTELEAQCALDHFILAFKDSDPTMALRWMKLYND